MILKSEFVTKFKSWLPRWFYEETIIAPAILSSSAKILESTSVDSEALVSETFIDSSSEFLDLHGQDRGVDRQESESNLNYSKRIKASTNNSSCDSVSLSSLINSLLIRGQCSIKNDFESDLFLDREVFNNRGNIFITKIWNCFSVVVDKQVHQPYSYFDREFFCNTEDFNGEFDSDINLFNSIQKIIDNNMAFGILFRIIERLN